MEWHGQVDQARGEATRRFPPKTAPDTLIAKREASGDEMRDETPDAQDELHRAPPGTFLAGGSGEMSGDELHNAPPNGILFELRRRAEEIVENRAAGRRRAEDDDDQDLDLAPASSPSLAPPTTALDTVTATGEATRWFPPKTAPDTEIGAIATATGEATRWFPPKTAPRPRGEHRTRCTDIDMVESGVP